MIKTLVLDQIVESLLDRTILGLTTQGETYRYGIMMKLKNQGFPEVSEGSIYSVLIRLNKKGYVNTVIKKSSNGDSRREYYTVIDSGLKRLKVFKSKWQVLNRRMISLFGGKNDAK